jgi:carnitine 3-dehydrogenase
MELNLTEGPLLSWTPRWRLQEVQTVGVVGGGLIGCGWAATFLHHGLNVIIVDPDPIRRSHVHQKIAVAAEALRGREAHPKKIGTIDMIEAIDDRFADVQFVQESTPERLDLKRSIISAIDSVVDPGVVIATSTSTLMVSALAPAAKTPARVIAGHPFNPVHLIPLVELVGATTEAELAIEWASAFYRRVGKSPVKLMREASGFIANRIARAVWREAIHIFESGIADIQSIDDAVKYGPGLRFATMGPFETYHLAGGHGGIKHYFEQFGPGIQKGWEDLGSPVYDADLKLNVINAVEGVFGNASISSLEQARDHLITALCDAIEKTKSRTVSAKLL